MASLIRTIIMRFGGAFFTLFLAIYLARTIGATGSGEYYYVFALVVVLSQFIRLGLDNAVLRLAGRYNACGRWSELRRLNADVLTYLLIVSGVFLGIFGVLAHWISKLLFSGDAISSFYYIALLSVVPYGIAWSYASILKGIGKAGLSVFVEVGIVPLLVLVILSVFSYGGSDLNSRDAVHALFVSSVLSALVATLLVWKSSGVDFSGKDWGKRISALHKDSLTNIWSVISNSLIVWVPMLLVGALTAPADVGVYNAAFRVTMLIGAFSSIFKSVVAPRLSALAQDPSEVHSFIRLHTLYIGIFLFVLLILALGGLDAIFMLFGKEFSEAKFLAYMMLFGQFVNVLVILVETMLVIDNRSDLLKRNAIFTLVFSVPITTLLTLSLGVYGAAAGFALTNVASRAGLLYLFNRSYKCRI